MMSTQDLLREEISPLSRKHISDIATDLIIDGQDLLAREILSEGEYWKLRYALQKQGRIFRGQSELKNRTARKASTDRGSKKHKHSQHGSYECEQCRTMRLQGFRYRIIRLYDDFADLLVAMKGDCLSLNKHCKFLTITMAHAIGEGTGSQIVKHYKWMRQAVQHQARRRGEVASLSYVAGKHEEDGATHYHVLLLASYIIDEKWLMHYWQERTDSIIHIQDITADFQAISRIASYMAANLNYAHCEIRRRFHIGDRVINLMNDPSIQKEISDGGRNGELHDVPRVEKKCDGCYQKDWPCMLQSQSAIDDCEGPFTFVPGKGRGRASKFP